MGAISSASPFRRRHDIWSGPDALLTFQVTEEFFPSVDIPVCRSDIFGYLQSWDVTVILMCKHWDELFVQDTSFRQAISVEYTIIQQWCHSCVILSLGPRVSQKGLVSPLSKPSWSTCVSLLLSRCLSWRTCTAPSAALSWSFWLCWTAFVFPYR